MMPRYGEHEEEEWQDPLAAVTPLPAPEEPLSDLGNARRFLATHGKDLLYVPRWRQWLVWDGTRWAADELGVVPRLVAEEARGHLVDCITRARNVARDERVQWAIRSESRPRFEAVVEIASTAAGVPVLSSDLDADPYLLNFQNGTLDLRTGELRQHDRADRIARCVAGEYDPDAAAPRFEAFLERIQPDPEVRDYLARNIGHALVGTQLEHILTIFIGKGANGKGTLLGLLEHVLGDYAASIDNSLITGDAHTEVKAALEGRRLVHVSETSNRVPLNEAQVKNLTGGDRVPARHLYGRPYEFDPTHTLILATNHLPEVSGTDAGIWRRLTAVEFGVMIPEEERDPGLKKRLEQEAEGVLAWLVRGCLDWQRRGLDPPEAVRATTRSYRAAEDHFARFIEERCFLNGNVTERAKTLADAYAAFCRSEMVQPLRSLEYGARLRDLGAMRTRGSKGYVWRGIEVVPDEV